MRFLIKMCVSITVFIVIIQFFFSCKKKDEINLKFNIINVGEEINLKKITFRNDSVGFCCGGYKNIYGAIFKTNDAGKTWHKNYFSNKYCINDVFFLNDSIGYACGDSLTLYTTRTGGNTWNKYTFPNLPWLQFMFPLNNIYFFSEEKGFIVGGEHYSKGGISKTFTGGALWYHPSSVNEMNCIMFTDEYTAYIGGYGIIYKTTDGGLTFNPCNIRGDWYVSLSFSDNNTGFAVGYDGGIYKTSDGGENWKTIDNGNTLFSKRSHLKHIIFSTDNKGYIVGTNGLLLISENAGNTWTKSANICSETLNCSFMTQNHTLFICSETGNIYYIPIS